MRLTVGEDTETILSSSRPEEHAFGQTRPRSAVITREFRLARAQVDAEAAAAKPELAVRRRGYS